MAKGKLMYELRKPTALVGPARSSIIYIAQGAGANWWARYTVTLPRILSLSCALGPVGLDKMPCTLVSAAVTGRPRQPGTPPELW